MTQPPDSTRHEREQQLQQPAPIDSDVDLHDPRQRRELDHHHPLVLGAVALGGVLGAEARWGLARWVTHAPGMWPWATLATNLVGCLLIGVLMATLGRVRIGSARAAALTRPFLGTGILGGFTTFSTYALDIRELGGHGQTALAVGYAATTIAGCLIAVAVGTIGTRSLLASRPASGSKSGPAPTTSAGSAA